MTLLVISLQDLIQTSSPPSKKGMQFSFEWRKIQKNYGNLF